MNDKQPLSVFWFRRDLRLEDNNALYEALQRGFPVLPLFIFDTEILNGLEPTDPRVSFIHNLLSGVADQLEKQGSGLYCKKGRPEDVWAELIKRFDIRSVFANEDYEPYGISRDASIEALLAKKGIPFKRSKDHVIFAKNEVLKNDGKPYTVFTPYKNKWLDQLNTVRNLPGAGLVSYAIGSGSNFIKAHFQLPGLEELGFKRSVIQVSPYELDHLENYERTRDFPALDQTSHLGPHLRFGSVSIREVLRKVRSNQTFVSELIWREFFMQILYHFPHVVSRNFRSKYDGISWRNREDEFEKWKKGETGYPMVDAGMRELNATGHMHNRVRMITAGFLCKHLLIDWRWGEAYFAEKLLDFELSSNNGNWQWAAGTGCDAAPYFRVFNPTTQAQKFDKDGRYIRKWVPELNGFIYPEPMVEHRFARLRAIETYKKGIQLYI